MRKTITLLTILLLVVFMVGCENSINPIQPQTQNDNEGISLAKKGGGNYSTYATIQEAIDNANPGDVITIAPGIYAEQVEIRDLNDLHLNGYGVTITVPAGGMTGSLVKIVNCENFKFDGFTIDGNEGVGVSTGASNGGGDADTRFYGLLAINSSGHILNNVITGIGWHNGVQQGLGIYVFVTDGVWRNMNISENEVTNWNKGGISIRGTVKSKVHKNFIQHWGETGITAPNGLQIDGGTGSVTNNHIKDCLYFDENHQLWASSGMLLIGWYVSGDNFRVVNNTVENCDVGIWFWDYGAGLTNGKIINNKVFDCIWPIEHGNVSDIKDHANKYE